MQNEKKKRRKLCVKYKLICNDYNKLNIKISKLKFAYTFTFYYAYNNFSFCIYLRMCRKNNNN